jgi:hypothetical protein
MDLFDTLTFVEILVQTTFLGTLSLTVPLIKSAKALEMGVFLAWLSKAL